jgi:hypothetical protein
MASLCRRIALNSSRRNVVYSCVRLANTCKLRLTVSVARRNIEKEMAIGILHDWYKFLNGVSLVIAREWGGACVCPFCQVWNSHLLNQSPIPEEHFLQKKCCLYTFCVKQLCSE